MNRREFIGSAALAMALFWCGNALATVYRPDDFSAAQRLDLRAGDRVEFPTDAMLFGNLTVTASGTKERPIVTTTASGGGRARLCNPHFTNDFGRVIDVRGSDVVIENLAFFDGPVPPPDPGLAIDAIGVQHRSVPQLGAVFIDAESRRVAVRNCEFTSCPIGIRVRGCDCQVVSNRLHDAGKIMERWGAIAVAMTGSRLELAHNEIWNYGYLGGFFGGDGAAFEIDGEDPTAYPRPISGIAIHHNRTTAVKGGFIEVTRCDVKGISLTDNYSDDQDKFAGFYQLADGVRIERNTIIRRRAPLEAVFWGATTNAVYSGNRLELSPGVEFWNDDPSLRRAGCHLGFGL
jgi:hypothetical protein